MVTGPLDERVRDRLVAETRGNPLALLELPHGRTPAELAGGFGLPDGPALSGRIEQSFRERLAPLPSSTRRLLLVAAAEPVGDPVLVWRAAAELGIEPDAAAPATAADWSISARRCVSPIRSCALRSTARRRRRSGRAPTAHSPRRPTPEIDPDRRAWHRAHATTWIDEDVAAELERSAGRARRAAAWPRPRLFSSAQQVAPDSPRRARRSLAAAQSKQRAGAPDAALRLLGFAEAGPLDELDQARLELLRGQVTFAVTRGADAPQLLLQAAKRLEPLDSALARETYLDAFAAALFADQLTRGVGAREIAEAVLAAEWGEATRRSPRLSTSCSRASPWSRSTATRLVRRRSSTRCVGSMTSRCPTRRHCAGCGWHAAWPARSARRRSATDELTERQVRLAREAGELSLLPIALAERFSLQLFLGNLLAAEALVLETEVVAAATGSRLAPQGALLAALRGDEAEATALIDAGRREVVDRGEGLWLVITEWASAVLFNSLGRYEEALAAAEQTVAHPHELGVSTWVQPGNRGRRTQRPSRARRRPTAPAPGDQQRRRHGLGARRRGALTRVAQRG